MLCTTQTYKPALSERSRFTIALSLWDVALQHWDSLKNCFLGTFIITDNAWFWYFKFYFGKLKLVNDAAKNRKTYSLSLSLSFRRPVFRPNNLTWYVHCPRPLRFRRNTHHNICDSFLFTRGWMLYSQMWLISIGVYKYIVC